MNLRYELILNMELYTNLFWANRLPWDAVGWCTSSWLRESCQASSPKAVTLTTDYSVASFSLPVCCDLNKRWIRCNVLLPHLPAAAYVLWSVFVIPYIYTSSFSGKKCFKRNRILINFSHIYPHAFFLLLQEDTSLYSEKDPLVTRTALKSFWWY